MLDSTPLRPIPRWAPLVVVTLGVLGFTAYAARGIYADPDVVMLLPRDGAQWIKAPAETVLFTYPPDPAMILFRHHFLVNESPGAPLFIEVTAFRRVQVFLDRTPLLQEQSNPENWKVPRRIDIPGPLSPGQHTLLVAAFNEMGPPAVRVSAPLLGIASTPEWGCSTDGRNWVSASPVSRIATPPLALSFPTPAEQLRQVAPLLAAVCLLAAAFSWRAGIPGTTASRIASFLTPARVRFAIQAALLSMGLHTMFIANLMIGSDAAEHYKYIHWFDEHVGVPHASEGPQHFQAPLFYWIAGAMHRSLSSTVEDHDTLDRALRILPILCGLALVELTYRMLRRAFPANPRAQFAGLVAGGFVPLLVYKTQFVSNEPLAALLGGAAILALLRLLDDGQPAGARSFVVAGALFALAILAKVSTMVLAAPIALCLVYWWYAARPRLTAGTARVAAYAGAFVVVCGWYLALNVARYGKPFIGGWGEEVGFAWWQMPGYRTPGQFYSFGAALVRPVFAAVQGFPDALYSALWFDSTLGGIVNSVNHPKWNYPFAESALLWALLPTAAIFAGGIRVLFSASGADSAAQRAHQARVLSLFAVGAFGASILAFALSLPYYAPIKPSYGMAALPSLAVLIALGLEPLTHYRATRSVLHAWLAGWVLLVCAGYWVLAP